MECVIAMCQNMTQKLQKRGKLQGMVSLYQKHFPDRERAIIVPALHIYNEDHCTRFLGSNSPDSAQILP